MDEAGTARFDLTGLAVTWALLTPTVPACRGTGWLPAEGHCHLPVPSELWGGTLLPERRDSPTWPCFANKRLKKKKKSITFKSSVVPTGLLLPCDFQSFPEKASKILYLVSNYKKEQLRIPKNRDLCQDCSSCKSSLWICPSHTELTDCFPCVMKICATKGNFGLREQNPCFQVKC